MKESAFYNLCDDVEELGGASLSPDMNRYFPTVDEINELFKEQVKIEEITPMLLYLASNPYKEETSEEYKKSVKYAGELVAQIEIEPD